jgi:hypothetical protein
LRGSLADAGCRAGNDDAATEQAAGRRSTKPLGHVVLIHIRSSSVLKNASPLDEPTPTNDLGTKVRVCSGVMDIGVIAIFAMPSTVLGPTQDRIHFGV